MRAVLALGGDRPGRALILRETEGADLVLGVDRGAAYLTETGVIPDRVVGDLDSLDEGTKAVLAARGVPIDSYPARKDETDGQLAVDLALGLGARDITLLAADGGRPDHAMANYLIMRRAARAGARVRMAAEWGEAMVARGEVELTGWPGRVVSILPLCESLDVGETVHLAYTVGQPSLTPDLTRGMSNVMTADRARVRIDAGWALIFLLN